ncbi:MAG: metal ABC transporter substrate-binding protein [Candidatus Zixiibacteriota bacterium]
MMKTILLSLLALFVLYSYGMAGIDVITSTSDLAYFAREIGGANVNVKAIAPPNADIHHIEVRPSYIMKLSKADVVFKIGMELDQWMDKLIEGSRNNNLEIVDCSKYIQPLEVPEFKADASYGDLHRFGNPHYWMNPYQVKHIVAAIAEGLAKADPESADFYENRRMQYLATLEKDIDALRKKAAPLAGVNVVFYHNSWPYFAEFTGVVAAGFIEPFPGVAPSPSQVKKITDLISGQGIKIIAVEPYFDKRVPEKIASMTEAKVVELRPSLGVDDKNESYTHWLDYNIERLLEALQ